ncbi:SDR family NAD(P)-dependent oxidoreductase [Alteromonas gilva]|uniref:SDR family NAD(P)-dependent oxidoreductase n=1 Tax=Alteromonas gilva TaxID=2987522 RepID=A0ABT5L1J1_9ALTE|nr:SDR family NAD(P)-dependent oxidoreductase [Alteromonas gilva]MDC8830913.1 SDR family NAD(P)-dependent oxidoreductase [Alteromonas gilva]
MTPIAMVTGGNRGIGLEIVKGLLKLGYKVLLVGRDEDNTEQAAEECIGDVHPIVMDLSSTNAISDGVVQAQAVFGDIDILVNNAGVMFDQDVTELPEQDLQTAFDVHVKAPALLTKTLLPAMIDNNYGRIINVSSGWGSFAEGLEGPPAYAITKAALNALTVKTAAQIPAGKNVTVNAMCPGWVHTRMGGSDAPLSPEEGADTAVWLAGQDKGGPNGLFFRQRKPINW